MNALKSLMLRWFGQRVHVWVCVWGVGMCFMGSCVLHDVYVRGMDSRGFYTSNPCLCTLPQSEAAKPAAQSSSQLHPVPVMPVERLQQFKAVGSRDRVQVARTSNPPLCVGPWEAMRFLPRGSARELLGCTPTPPPNLWASFVTPTPPKSGLPRRTKFSCVLSGFIVARLIILLMLSRAAPPGPDSLPVRSVCNRTPTLTDAMASFTGQQSADQESRLHRWLRGRR